MSKKPEPEFALDDIAKEFAEQIGKEYVDLAGRNNDPGITAVEYAVYHGISNSTAQVQIRRLLEAGKLIEGVRYGKDKIGRWKKVRVVRPKEPKKGGEIDANSKR